MVGIPPNSLERPHRLIRSVSEGLRHWDQRWWKRIRRRKRAERKGRKEDTKTLQLQRSKDEARRNKGGSREPFMSTKRKDENRYRTYTYGGSRNWD